MLALLWRQTGDLYGGDGSRPAHVLGARYPERVIQEDLARVRQATVWLSAQPNAPEGSEGSEGSAVPPPGVKERATPPAKVWPQYVGVRSAERGMPEAAPLTAVTQERLANLPATPSHQFLAMGMIVETDDPVLIAMLLALAVSE